MIAFNETALRLIGEVILWGSVALGVLSGAYYAGYEAGIRLTRSEGARAKGKAEGEGRDGGWDHGPEE